MDVDIPDVVIDRVHHLGRPRIVKGKRVHQVIVRFTIWRHRVLVYRARINCTKYRIKLDLTRRRIEAIDEMNKFLKSKRLGSAFADVDCRLCAKIGNEIHHITGEENSHDII